MPNSNFATEFQSQIVPPLRRFIFERSLVGRANQRSPFLPIRSVYSDQERAQFSICITNKSRKDEKLLKMISWVERSRVNCFTQREKISETLSQPFSFHCLTYAS
ncbi:hypothetical protein NPIL_550301 [Nephila pilipes]|uniref:Uncharacterized protein n=1 Tax=Nephila pilipes TaxID=299642 RepID=A0A8X6QLP3_NEPPI|nr:hypothetical protein NPIL_550301 [Nephila pilipes]